jgi:hypothetical protein
MSLRPKSGPLSFSVYHEIIFFSVSYKPADLESREYGLGIRHADHVALSLRKKLALTSPTSGCRSVGIVRSRTEATEFFIYTVRCFSIFPRVREPHIEDHRQQVELLRRVVSPVAMPLPEESSHSSAFPKATCLSK